MKRRFLTFIAGLVLITFFATPDIQAQWILLAPRTDTLVKAGLKATYNLHYSEADSLFNRIIVDHPEHPSGYFLKALVDWWRIIPNVEADNMIDRVSVSFNKNLDSALAICQRRLDANPGDIVGLFFKGSALGYRARLVTLRSFSSSSLVDWLGAAKDGKEAYDVILKCQQLAPSNSDILLGSGLYNYFSAYVREELPAIGPMLDFLPPGDRKLGLQMLSIASRRAVYAATEAKYSTVELLTNMERDYVNALPVAKALYEQYPGNSVFHKFYARNLFNTNRWNEADSAWHEIIRRIQARQPGYELSLALQATYYLGYIRFLSNDFENASKLLSQTIVISKRFNQEESSWAVLATLRLGFTYDRMGRRSDAIKMYKQVLDMKEYSSSHSDAERFLKKPY